MNETTQLVTQVDHVQIILYHDRRKICNLRQMENVICNVQEKMIAGLFFFFFWYHSSSSLSGTSFSCSLRCSFSARICLDPPHVGLIVPRFIETGPDCLTVPFRSGLFLKTACPMGCPQLRKQDLSARSLSYLFLL